MNISTSAQNWTPEELFDFVKAQYAPVVEYKGVTMLRNSLKIGIKT